MNYYIINYLLKIINFNSFSIVYFPNKTIFPKNSSNVIKNLECNRNYFSSS